jgi:hypothetical protein
MEHFLKEMPDRLLRRVVERFQDCGGDKRLQMEEALQGFFHAILRGADLSHLVDRDNSRIFSTWAEFDPKHGLAWLKEAVNNASKEQLEGFDGHEDGSGGWRGRRQIVWLCEHLACFGEYFRDCEEILFRLAQVETEPSIGNNSSAVWREMFWPVLACTEVPFPDRGNLLLQRLRDANPVSLNLVLSAGYGALSSPHMFFRLVPPAVVGGRLVPEGWEPRSYAEIEELQVNFARAFLDEVTHLKADLCRRAVVSLIEKMEPFLYLGLIDKLRETFRPVVVHEEIRRELHLHLQNAIDFRERVLPSPNGGPSEQEKRYIDDLRRWAVELAPRSLAAKVQELTALDPWTAVRMH